MADKKEKPEVKLTKEELQLLAQLLTNSRWTPQEYEQTVKPLINKLAGMLNLGDGKKEKS